MSRGHRDTHKVLLLADDIFNLFKKKGPRDVADICIEFPDAELADVTAALDTLEYRGMVAIWPDHHSKVSDNEMLVVWGLPTLL